MKSRPLGRKGVVVGDGSVWWATCRATTAAWPGSSRSTSAGRCCAGPPTTTDPVERIVVANADQLVVVAALADPEPRPRLIDRALVAAYDAGLDPLLCMTKADLADPETLLVDLPPAGCAVRRRRSAARPGGGAGTAARDRSACSSATQRSRQVDPRQRPGPRQRPDDRPRQRGDRPRAAHVDVGADAGPPPDRPGGGPSGWIVDTPGIRSFGLAHVEPAQLIGAFDGPRRLTDDCPRGCTHGEDEPECGSTRRWPTAASTPRGWSSFRRLLASREQTDD